MAKEEEVSEFVEFVLSVNTIKSKDDWMLDLGITDNMLYLHHKT